MQTSAKSSESMQFKKWAEALKRPAKIKNLVRKILRMDKKFKK